MAGEYIRNPATGVLWDLHTCPVPAGVDARRVRAIIESALEKYFGGPRPVTFIGVGNLEFVSPRVLEGISSSGIFLRHAPFRALSVLDILNNWRIRRRITHVLLISGDKAWFNKGFHTMGFTILCAYPLPRPPPFPTYHSHTKALVYPTYPDTKQWFWESLLEANLGALQTSNEVIFKDQPACMCRLCGFRSQRCADFIKHLQSTKHQEKAFTVRERKYLPLNANYEPQLFCRLCKYYCDERRHMAKHYNSEQHSLKKLAIQTVAEPSFTHEEEKPSVTHEEEITKRFGVAVAGEYTRNPTTGVLWDLHTCPVPAGVDPRRVRAILESALEKEFDGRRPVTVIGVGNLEFVSPRVLEKISSAGICLRHAPFRALSVSEILNEWERKCVTHVLLISNDPEWFSEIDYPKGFNILRLLPLPRPPPFPTYNPLTKAWVYPTYLNTKEWFWETLLEANSGALLTSSEVIFTDEPACWCECKLCGFRGQSCADFIKHLKSTEHQEEAFKVRELKYLPLNANYEPELVCRLCKYFGRERRHMAKHYKSEEHSLKKLAIQTLAEPSFTHEEEEPSVTHEEEAYVRSQKVEGVQEITKRFGVAVAGEYTRNPTTGVLWDLHTCPVPAGVDPRRVRAIIESALEKEFDGRRPVTVIGVGNLEFVSPRVLEKMSSAGICLRHAPFRALSVSEILNEWERKRVTHVLLISNDPEWFSEIDYPKGFNILRLLPLPRPPPFPTYHTLKAWVHPTYPNTKEWFWETLLEANSGALQTSSEVIFTDEPACWCECELCAFRSQSCDDFIKHLKSTEHQEEAFKVRELKYLPLNANYEPELVCRLCKYFGDQRRDMAKHYQSEQHSLNKLAVQTLAEPSFTHEEEEPSVTHEEEAYVRSQKVEGVQEITKRFGVAVAGDYTWDPTTGVLWGVLWDLDTCPVPSGFERIITVNIFQDS